MPPFCATDTSYGGYLLLREERYHSPIGAEIPDDGIIDDIAVARLVDSGTPRPRLSPREVVCAVASAANAGRTDTEIAALFQRYDKSGTRWVWRVRNGHRIAAAEPPYDENQLARLLVDQAQQARASKRRLAAAGVLERDAA